jgi:hypothetical protein
MQTVHDFLKKTETYYLATADGNTVVYYLRDAIATFSSFTGEGRVVRF